MSILGQHKRGQINMYKLDFYFVLQSIHTKISIRKYGAFIKKNENKQILKQNAAPCMHKVQINTPQRSVSKFVVWTTKI